MYEMMNIPPHKNCIGCGECCGPVLATTREIDVIRLHIAKNPTIRAVADTNQNDDSALCCFLDSETRRCLIYPVRPMVCRLMGIAGGMTCANGNTCEIDGTAFLQEHSVGKLRLLNTEDW